MKRIAWTFIATSLVCGCGGDEQSAAAKTQPVVSEARTATTTASTKPTAGPAESKPPAKKPSDEPPGLVLPEHEPEAIGAKGLELPPIR